jgi:hypothetical protein
MTEEEVSKFVLMMNDTFFIKSNIHVPYETMMLEFNNFIKFNTLELVPFKTDSTRQFNLDVLGLIDLVNDPQQAGSYILGNMRKDIVVQKTTLYKYFPNTIDWIFENIPGVFRCKISRLKAGETANWHNHPHRLQKFDAVLHIPLVSNPDVKMHVRYKDNISSEQECYFEPGKLWFFNAGPDIEHAVTNNSSEDRWHLWINTLIIDKYNNARNQRLVDDLIQSRKQL